MKFKYSIPDLSALKLKSGTLLLHRAFRAGGPKDYIAFALVMNFIRMVDLAVSAYQNGREDILEFPKDRQTIQYGLMMNASGNFELCVDLIKRAISFLKAIKAHKDVPQSMKDLVPKGTIVLSGGVEKKVTDMRGAIQHLEERIRKGKIKNGQPHALYPKEDGIHLGTNKISYKSLSEWLIAFNKIADVFANYYEKGTP
jgi:hypothetical protein